jgi:glycosyltransferase involved in cell wall biosynthesis
VTPAVHFIGLLKSPVSWAKVGRELVAALSSSGAHVSAVSLKGYMYDESYALAALVKDAIGRERHDGWDVALDYPPNFARLNGRHKAGIIIYEADRLPSHWVEPINRHLDLAIVPSAFCRDAALASGVTTRIEVVPFGVNAFVYTPDGPRMAAPTGRTFNFLTVAAPHVRKGLKETVEAFTQAFAPGDDTGLIIKCPPLASLGRRPWEYGRVGDFLPDARGGQIALIEGSWGEEEMAALYRSCDVYMQASYGESFGLAAVEAAACGKPVITTGYGAAGEIWSDESAWLTDCDLVDAGPISYDWRSGEVHAARPRVESLAAAMRQAFEDRAEAERKAQAALTTARRLTWDASARALLAALSPPHDPK